MADLLALPIDRDPLAGHLGHLSPSQEAALAEMRVLVDQSLEGAEGAREPIEDSVLLRFLRARKFDPAAGTAQYLSTVAWRTDNAVEALYDNFDISEFALTSGVYPAWTGRRDRLGLPLYIFEISELTKDKVGAFEKEKDRLERRMIALYEHMVQFALPFATAVPHGDGTPVSSTVTIVDVSNVSLARFWALRSHMQRASVLASANYAETLGRIYLVGAPSFFSVVWGWIKSWFDPGTVDKIFIIAEKDVLATLTQFIALEDIPEAYGGTLPFKYGVDRPILDQAAKDTLGLDFLPEGPIRFIDGELVLKGSGRTAAEVAQCVPKAKAGSVEKLPLLEESKGLPGGVDALVGQLEAVVV